MLPTPVLTEMPTRGPLVDRFGRTHTYLRLSVTDRCNYRCVYCMPLEGIDWTAREDLLTYEEMARLVRVFARMGTRGIRITGGEPTVRRDLDSLVGQIASIEGIEDIAMTTNGHRLGSLADRLARAGLQRVNISLDTLDPEVFSRVTRGGNLERVLEGIEAARVAGLTPIKINCVVVADENEDQLDRLIDYCGERAEHMVLRFIEYMPFGIPGRRHVASRTIRERLAEHVDLQPDPRKVGRGPANNWVVRGTGLRVGFISAMTEHFCHLCNRLRLQCNGELRTCLSRERTPSLRDALRSGMDDEALEQCVRALVWGKVAGHEADAGVPFEGAMIGVGG